MARHSTIPPSQRALLFATVVLLHALLFALLITARSRLKPVEARPTAMVLVAIEPEAAQAPKPPPPPMPSETSSPRLPSIESAEFDPDSRSLSPAAGGRCAPLEAIADALAEDLAAFESVRQASFETRSLNDAIVIWNEGWVPAASRAEAPLGAARAAVEQALGALPSECLAPGIVGPRFVPLADGEATRFVVFGSGRWSWKQLLDDSLATGTADLQVAPAVEATPTPWWKF